MAAGLASDKYYDIFHLEKRARDGFVYIAKGLLTILSRIISIHVNFF